MHEKNNEAEMDAGNEPVRMCVICHGRFVKKSLNRHVVSVMGDIAADLTQTAPGRGIYVCASPHCAAKFVKYRPKRAGRGKHV
jgi:predicted RNA-binding protein YlxR (DUF448 family)